MNAFLRLLTAPVRAISRRVDERIERAVALALDGARDNGPDDIGDLAELVMAPRFPDTAAALIAAWSLIDPVLDPYDGGGRP